MKLNRVKWIFRYGVMLCFRIWLQTDLNSSWMQISLTLDCVAQASYLAASLTHLLLSIFPLPYWLCWAYAPSRAYWGGPQPRALTSTHQRLLMEDVNICSGASHGSPSLCRDCSKHINISEAKGTSGHAVPLSVRTGKHDGGWDRVLPSIACVWTPLVSLFPFFLVTFWPCVAPRSGQLVTTRAHSERSLSGLLYPMTLELPLNFYQSLLWNQLFTKQCHQ